MRRAVVVFTLLMLGGGLAAAPKARPDKPVTYCFDLTREGDAKPTILTVKLPQGFWQHSDHPPAWAPGTAVRKGWGAAWWSVADYYSNLCQEHVFLEIEEMGKRKLKEAADDHNKTLEEVCTKALIALRNDPSRPKKEGKFKLGKKGAEAYSLRYNQRPQGVPETVVDPARVLLFEVNGWLVTLTSVRGGTRDFHDDVVKGLGLADTALVEAGGPFKLLDLTEGVSKYVTFDVPPGFRRVYRYERSVGDALWEQRGKDGKVVSRLALSNYATEGKAAADSVAERTQRYKDHYENVVGPEEFAVGERKGLRVAFTDASKEEETEVRSVRKVFIELHREVWELTIETLGGDESMIEADRKSLDLLLASVEMWRSRID